MEPSLDDATTRIDLSHVPQRDETAAKKSSRRRKVAQDVRHDPREVGIDLEELGRRRAPVIMVEPPDSVPEIVVRHADDLSVHLSTRLVEVERREVELAQHEALVRETETAARAWVAEQDRELTERQRQLQFLADELTTQHAAVAAAEIAAEQEAIAQRAVLNKHESALEVRVAELDQREEHLREQLATVQYATDKLHADRRRLDELARSQKQQWQNVQTADKAQAEKVYANLQKHRASLDERERVLSTREAALAAAMMTVERPAARDSINLESSIERAEAAREHRTALEQRWIAGQLWAKLAGSGLTSDDELLASLEQVRSQLERLYRREREALEDLRAAIAETAQRTIRVPQHPATKRARCAV